ncbi:giant cable pilus chaperone protein [Burkholderia multivorans]|uniref:hypothetical protein n=1 Tax=Burkholderia multivorans TaxID=87883 RepID=UPI0006A58E60|nr:hypothetical protein [Burkholderia multivorans]AOJ96381.1 hypothetical protein WK22_26485 [Burkholderia multivorans]KOE24621.1 hypothetical protein AI46_17885 [Burkholderia multivorans R-20526]MBU9237481.1 hypothetical protein [Burkholderia multivorans]MBU9246660.1 hypothetical protein [Burkholderia multivorans]MBU9335752.1 hypothetical protein [Burkholderia multivorans]
MNLSVLARFFATFTAYLMPASVLAAIDLIPKEVVVDGQETAVQIVNNGDRPEYVSISLSRLMNPGVPLAEEKVEPVGESDQPALYAFPFKISLAPGQSKTITLKSLRAVETETVYRLDVKPVLKVSSGEKASATGTVLVSLAFSGLVRQLPNRTRAGLSMTCDATGARLTATGNVRHTVKGAQVDGRVLDDFNVYPGVPLPLKGRVVSVPGQAACPEQAGAGTS